MSNKLIEYGNYDEKIHGYLHERCDAFGNKVIPPEGYRLLTNEKIRKGDIHFDIYYGWTAGGEDYAVKNGHHVSSEGRWRAWARKI